LNFDFGDEVKALREHARRVLRERCTSAVVRTTAWSRKVATGFRN